MSKVKPPIQVQKVGGQLLPLTRYDAERIEEQPNNQVFTIKTERHRSPPHHKLYWAILDKTVEATGRWPRSEKLHDDLKMLLGYHRAVFNQFTGDVYYVADSIAYQKMDQQEFNRYFEAAMSKISEIIEGDPMELLNDR